uniref:(northern house mosquito) hypothetical protein n=1 Tax=Culex pipiens TaxID=7175 RepID=A0A8D8C1T7_CULPI
MRQILDIARNCYQKIGIPTDSNVAERITFQQNVTYNEEELKYILCFQQEAGWFDVDDNFVLEPIVDFCMQNNAVDRVQVKESINKCIIRSNGLVLIEKARKFYDCFYENKQFLF